MDASKCHERSTADEAILGKPMSYLIFPVRYLGRVVDSADELAGFLYVIKN